MSESIADTARRMPVITEDMFRDWHPLKVGWLEELSPEIRAIVAYTQGCLAETQRTDRELAEALAQIKGWRKIYPQLIDTAFAPELVFDENLGTQLEPGAFANFLLAHPALMLKPYEYAALTLLQEASGLSDLYIVAKRDTVSPVAQHLTLKIARLHAAVVLLRRMNENPDSRDTVPVIIKALLGGGKTTA